MQLTTALLALTLCSSSSAERLGVMINKEPELDKRVAPAVAAGILGVAGGTALNAALTGVVKGTTSGSVKSLANKILGNPQKRSPEPIAPAVAAGIFGVAGGSALNAVLQGVVKGGTSGGVKSIANGILGNPTTKRQELDPVIPTEEVWGFEELRAIFAAAAVEKLFNEDAKEGEAAVCVSVEYEVEHDEKAREFETVELGNGNDEAFFDCFLLAGPNTFTVVGENSDATVAVEAPEGAWNATAGVLTL